MRIAVLDDDLLLLEQIKGTLECHHHVCHTYADGTSLLKALRHDTFDLLIVDWHLPDICLLYTSPSPRDKRQSRMPSSA